MFAKKLIFIALLLFSANTFAHTSISISVGGAPVYRPAYYPVPFYYGPPVMEQRVLWVPPHREHRYWVQGHYVEYVGPVARHGRVWMGNGYRERYWG